MSDRTGTGFYDRYGQEIKHGDIIVDDTGTKYKCFIGNAVAWLADEKHVRPLCKADLTEAVIVD
jgi:hypothetical protein